jgi:chemotaxis protein CheD
MNESERRRLGEGVEGLVVHPGEIALVDDGSRLVSVVSVGVLVCLWHYQGSHAVMAHFIEPLTYDPRKATPRFGNVSVPKAVAMMRELVGPLAVLEAQIFGGALREPGDLRGEANLSVARRILEARQVNVVSEDVGGQKGRKVIFDAGTGHAAVIKVHDLRKGDWDP